MSIVDEAGNALIAGFTGQAYTVNAASAGTFSQSVSINTVGRLAFPAFAPQGEVPSGRGLQISGFVCQTEVLNTWGDGSARHMMVYTDATSLGTKAITDIVLSNGTPFTPSWPTVNISFAGNSASLGAWDGTNVIASGAVAMRAWRVVNLGSLAQVLFDITSYAAGGHRVSITLMNIKNSASIDKITGALAVTVGGVVFSRMTIGSFTLWTGQMPQGVTYTGGITREANITYDFSPWQRARVIPKFGGSSTKTYNINESTNSAYSLGGGVYNNEIGVNQWSFGEATANAADSENAGRQELNPWCDWEQRYFFYGSDDYLQVINANAMQQGLWTAAVCKASDPSVILRMDEDTNYATINTDVASANGLNWPLQSGFPWRGALTGGFTPNFPANTVVYDRQHVSDMVSVAYWLTGDQGYLWKIRHGATWALFQSYIPFQENDPNVWPGWFLGRDGVRGLLSDVEMGRAFGRPLKLIARAAFSMPDAYSSDRTYFKTYTQNQLDFCGDYIDYIDIQFPGASTWGHFVGMQPSPTEAWGYLRYNSVSSTTGANPTVLTVIGDNSGIGTGTNDHAMQTGDFVTLSGFSGGASGLNGRWAITRLSATSFSVAVNTTGSPTAGQGTWSTARGFKNSQWRNSVTTREVAWCGQTGFFTMTASIWAFVDRMGMMGMAFQENPDFDTAPGNSYNYYPTSGVAVGNNFTWATSWATYLEMNTRITATAAMIDSQANYTLYGSATHRGNIQGWNDATPNEYYTIYGVVAMAQYVDRGGSGALAAYNRLIAASGVLGELLRRPGFFYLPY